MGKILGIIGLSVGGYLAAMTVVLTVCFVGYVVFGILGKIIEWIES